MMLRRRMPIYDPASDPDLFYWFDAADQSTLIGPSGAAIADGSRVHEWINKGSAAANMYTVRGASFAPYWRSNTFGGGRPSVDFSPANNYVLAANDLSGFNGWDGFTVLVACGHTRVPPSPTYGGRVFCVNNMQPNARFYVRAGSDYTASLGGTRTAGNTDPLQMMSLSTWSLNVPMILGGSFDYSGRRAIGVRDGIQINQIDPFHDGGTISWGTLQNIAIGGEGGTLWAHFFCGHVFEVLLWSRALTPQELVGPHHYLRTKWGIEPTSSGGMGLTPGFGGEEEESMPFGGGELETFDFALTDADIHAEAQRAKKSP